MFVAQHVMRRCGRYELGVNAEVESAEDAIVSLAALPGDVLWLTPVGEEFKFDFRVEHGPDGLGAAAI